MSQGIKTLIACCMGFPALFVVGYYTCWQVAVAVFIMQWADNIDKG